MNMQQATTNLHEISNDYDDIKAAKQLILDLIAGYNSARGVAGALGEAVKADLSPAQAADDGSEYFYQVQELFISLIKDVPFAHQPLAELLALLYEHPDETLNTGIWGTFGMNAGDAHSALMYDPDHAVQYVNFNAFEARLWQLMDRESEKVLTGSPLRNFARSIENEKPEGEFQSTDAEVGAACMWAVHGSAFLWKLCRAGDRDAGGKQFCGDLWRGEDGYSVERWRLWVHRFRDVEQGHVRDVNEETERYAAAAVANLVAVETAAA